MTLEELHKAGNDVAGHWRSLMPMMTCEEACEFVQSISKMERMEARSLFLLDADEECRRNLVKEFADVIIAGMALCQYYDIDEAWIEEAIRAKLEKVY